MSLTWPTKCILSYSLTLVFELVFDNCLLFFIFWHILTLCYMIGVKITEEDKRKLRPLMSVIHITWRDG